MRSGITWLCLDQVQQRTWILSPRERKNADDGRTNGDGEDEQSTAKSGLT